MSQSDLAARVNALLSEEEKQLTQQNINALESRDSNKTEHAYYMAIALNVSLVWLLTGRGSMEVSNDALRPRSTETHTNAASLIAASSLLR